MNGESLDASGTLTAPGFARVAAVFDAQLAAGLHHGAQLCVRLGGKIVVDRWGGFADRARARPVLRDTPFMAYSATKAFTAACVHLLSDRGLLDLDGPVAAIWPAFGRHGKESITIRQLLTHQAGIPGKTGAAELLSWLSPRAAARRVAGMKPVHAPGARTMYHSTSAGWALGEIIRRVSGLEAAEFLRREFLEPLGMRDSFPGLPPREYRRASRIHSGDRRQALAAAVFSNPLYRSLYLPAASLNTTASDLAVFYDMLRAGGERSGRRYLSSGAVAGATAMRHDGPDGDSGLRVRWASGFGLGGYSPFPDEDIRHMGRGADERSFGHSGQGGCAFGWADPSSGLVFAFTCNRFLELKAAHARFRDLADACWGALGR